MNYRTTRDIVIPAGTLVSPAPKQSTRFTAHGEVLVALDKDGTASLAFDIDDAVRAGLLAGFGRPRTADEPAPE